jgi:F0F1-type ATP synthase assembly protein I
MDPIATESNAPEAKSKSGIVVSVLTMVLVTVAFQVPQFRTFAYGGLAGMLVGLWPASFAGKRGQKVFGQVSWFLCLAAGIAGGLIFSVPLAVILVVIAFFRGKNGA